jgi:hypothetical protein
VDFIDRGGIFRLGRWRVINKDSGEAAIGNDISDEALMRWEVAEDPAAAVYEEEAWQSAGAAGGAHDGEAHLQTVLRDRFFLNVARGQLKRNGCLGIHEYLARCGGR